MAKAKAKENPNNEEQAVKNSMILQTFERSVKRITPRIGLIIIIAIIVVCVCAPLLTHYGVNEYNLKEAYQSPSLQHLFGTDELGRDVFTRILYGGRYSLALGFIACTFQTVFGIVVGCIAGYYGGIVESVIMRCMDVLSALPGTLLAILIASSLGGGFGNTVLALSVSTLPGGVRIIRAQILSERTKEYIEAAEAFNCSKVSIMFRHILPNVISPMIISFTMGIGSMITAAASLSYLGLGINPPSPEWGAMLAEGQSHINSYPFLIIFPGLAIALIILAFNLYGDGLRDALDPKLRQ